MFKQLMHVESAEHKTMPNNAQFWQVQLQDIREKKGVKELAFEVLTEFWGSTQPCQTGDLIIVQGDLKYTHWQDQEGNDRRTLKLTRPKILDENDNDITPKKTKEIEI